MLYKLQITYDGRMTDHAVNRKVGTTMKSKLHTLVVATVIGLGCVGASSLAEAQAQECGPGDTVYAAHSSFSEPSTCSCGDGNVGFITGLVMGSRDNVNFDLRFNLDASAAGASYELTLEVLVTYPDGHTDWATLGSIAGGQTSTIPHSWHVADGHIEDPWAFRATCRLYTAPD